MLRCSALLYALLLPAAATCQQLAQHPAPHEQLVPNHFLIVYRNHTIPPDAARALALSGASLASRMDHLGLAAVTAPDSAQRLLAADPNVLAVLHDRYVTGHALQFPTLQSPIAKPATLKPTPQPHSTQPPVANPINLPISQTVSNPVDLYYTSPQGWAVQQSGGFGDNIPTTLAGPAPIGAWNITRGAGVRIAILDSGIDANHPSVAPNLVLNLSEVNQSVQTGLPSPCDDGTPQDQQGHGTWTASLAAAAIGSGQVIGVAPQASLLNIKVLQRMPAATLATVPAQCEAGEPGGLLSWVLQGIDDAIANHADVISLSLGTLVDLTTGDGAGWQSAFNQATYAAAQSGAVIVAALGNDSLDLSTGGFIELPAQARDVLPVVASTNPACAENLTPNATCAPGPITRPTYSNFGAANAISAPGGSFPEGADTAVSGFVRGACSSGLTNTTDGLPINGQSFGCFGFGHTQYVQAIGSSASAPLVAGAAALLHAANTTLTPAQIIATLLSSATPSATTTPQLNLPAALNLR